MLKFYEIHEKNIELKKFRDQVVRSLQKFQTYFNISTRKTGVKCIEVHTQVTHFEFELKVVNTRTLFCLYPVNGMGKN